MRLQQRLARLERILGQTESCSLCHDGLIQQLCTYEEDSDGTRRLVSGTPTHPCPQCGRLPRAEGISEVIFKLPGTDLSSRERDLPCD